MRTIVTIAASVALLSSLAAPALAQTKKHHDSNGAWLAGTAAGVGGGLALAHGIHAVHGIHAMHAMHATHAMHAMHGVHGAWLGTSAAGAAVGGFIIGVGTVALIDAVTQPCKGFHALFGLNKDHCVNGEYVEYKLR
jgi:hypothetical protein